MSKDKDTEIRSKYDDYSVEELKAALNAIFDSTDEFSDSQVEEMDKIMAVLTKKNPLPHRYTAEESWKIFQETYSEELSRIGIRNTEEVMEEGPEKDTVAAADPAVVIPETSAKRTVPETVTTESGYGKSHRRLFQTALIAAAVVAAMVIITVSASAIGLNIWGWVPVKDGGTFQYVSEDSVSKDIPSALKRIGIEQPLFPTWLPEGFVLHEQRIQLEEPIIITSVYLFKERVITITIREITDLSKLGIIEINDEPSVEYAIQGVTHNIFRNVDSVVSTWLINQYLVRISGDISINEMEKLIRSIYEVIE